MSAAIDTHALLQLVWAAPLAALSVTIAWSLVIHGTTRALEASRAGRSGAMGLHAVEAIVGAALFVAALAFGLVILTTKG